MTASITTFRTAVATAVSTATGIQFVSGYLDGPQRQDIGCTFPEKIEEGTIVADEELSVMVRIWKTYRRSTRNPELPQDPVDLETLAEQVQVAVRGIRTTAGPWFARVLDVTFDNDTFMIEATVRGWQTNIGV